MQLVKFFWFISILGAFGVNIYCYATFPNVVNYYFDTNGQPEIYINKELFFYYTLAIILIANVLFSLLGKIPAFVANEFLVIPNKKNWTTNKYSRKELNDKLKEWVRGLATLLNFFIMTVLGFIANANTESHFSLNWVQSLLMLLSVSWCIFFFVLFMKKPEALAD